MMSRAFVILTPNKEKHAEEELANFEILLRFAERFVDLLHIKWFSSPPKENAYLTHICRDSGFLNRRGSKPGLELYSIPSEKADPRRGGRGSPDSDDEGTPPKKTQISSEHYGQGKRK